MERSISILKFGGTSVGNGERIRRVANIVAHQARDQQEDFPAVVVSAMAGVTDQLLRIARLATTGEAEACRRELDGVKQKHLEAAEIVVHDPEARQTLCADLQTAFNVLEQDVLALQTAAPHGANIPLLTAAVGAWGERLSVLLTAAAVQDMGVWAAPVREEVIITSVPQIETPYVPGTVSGAEPLTEETRLNAQRLIAHLLASETVPVMAGFIGRTPDGCYTTLGRNGSDYSAAVIGAALDCVEVNIYTDVDGVLTADPRVVHNARLLLHLSYAEAAQLSWFGAKVLHPRTLIPLASRDIPVRVRNTFRPHTRGTVVGPVDTAGKQHSSAVAITIRHRLALITVESKDLFGTSENVSQIFALAARAGITPIAICASSGHHFAFMVEEAAADSVVALLQHDLENWRVSSRAGLAACACIGSGFTTNPMSPARAVTALAHERIPVITQGASNLGIVLIVEDADSERALRCLHRDLIAPVIPLVRHNVPDKEEKRRKAVVK